MKDKDQILLENIYTREILNEGRKERFYPMFQKLVQKFADLEDGFPYQYEDSSIRMEFGAKEKYDDEYKKEVKGFNLNDLETDFKNVIKKVSEIAKKENIVMIILKKIVVDMERKWKDMERYGVVFDGERDEDGDEITSSREDFVDYLKRVPKMLSETVEHWNSLPIPELQRYLKNVSPNEEWYIVARRANQIEEEWKAQGKKWIDVTPDIQDGNIQEIIKFPNNMGWFDLKRPYCKEEGDAMGHCGNSATRSLNDTVLSLRETKKQKNNTILSKPHLTFILKRGAFLGEMKGRANSKPKQEYHPYIMGLLMHKKQDGNYLVTRIEGGGYKPENNFDIEDLSDSDLQKITNERILLIADAIQEYMLKKQQISSRLKKAILNSPSKDKILKEVQVRIKALGIMKSNVPSTEKWPNVKNIDSDFTIQYNNKSTPEQIANFALNA